MVCGVTHEMHNKFMVLASYSLQLETSRMRLMLLGLIHVDGRTGGTWKLPSETRLANAR
jgi:hypothetical protein